MTDRKNSPDYLFQPWTVKDNTRVALLGDDWENPDWWNICASHQHRGRCSCSFRHPAHDFCDGNPNAELFLRHVVLVGVDVFEDWKGEEGEGEMTCPETGEPLSINDNGHVWPYGWPSMSDGDDWGVEAYTMDHVRSRLFWKISKTPNLDWILMPSSIENVRKILGQMVRHSSRSSPGHRLASAWLSSGHPPENVAVASIIEV